MRPWQIERRSASDNRQEPALAREKRARILCLSACFGARALIEQVVGCQLAELINRPPPEYTRKSENISICNGCGEMLQGE